MCQNVMSKPSIRSWFIYDPGFGYDVMDLHCRCPWAEMDRPTAGYKFVRMDRGSVVARSR